MVKDLKDLDSFYRSALTEATRSLQQVKSLIYRMGSIRLLLFVAGVVLCIVLWNEDWLWLAGGICFTFLPFLILVKYHNSLFIQKDYYEKKVLLYTQELAALGGDNSGFADGAEYMDSQHLFSYDLDIFGPKSLFQKMNRTTTSFGKRCLAGWISDPLLSGEKIRSRQGTIRELADDPAFRHEFRIAGLLSGSASSDWSELQEWVKQPVSLYAKPFLRYLPWVTGGVNAVLILLTLFGVLPYWIPGLVFVCFVTGSFTFSQRITKMQSSFEKRWKILNAYARMLVLIEQREMNNPELRLLKEQVTGEGIPASVSLNRLSKLLNALDQRNNVLIAALLNGLYFWELYRMMRIEAWKVKNAGYLLCWLDTIGKMEALSSMATFAFNNPDYTYPQVAGEPFVFQATDMGHPLMDRECCVKNDISISRRPYFMIVTGANMAGKSTYLRTVGINYVLACLGMPVCAEEMCFYPVRLITSLRTNDSLSENESYFFAELKRLSMILERLKRGEELFIILDEILRGTNSMDKQKGSMTLVRQFTELGANGILATHDLQLATLREVFPDLIANYCFEADIRDEELTFSYRMHEGVAQNMNACFLMKKMGFDL